MSRPLRIEMEGGLYHVTSRGDGRERIYQDDGDREMFLRVLGQTVERHRWLCHAYCLMGNHYHLLVETPDANLSKGMRHLNGVYTQQCNARHGRVGHVFQGRFRAVMVDREEHLLEVCRYVVLNPVRAEMVSTPEAWPWSSHCGVMGLAPCPVWLTADDILGWFGGSPDEARRRYWIYVLEGLTGRPPWVRLRGQVFLGGEAFMREIGDRLRERAMSREIPQAQRMVSRPPLDMLTTGCHDDKRLLSVAVLLATTRFDYTQREVAEHLGVHTSTVSRMIRSLEPSA